LNFKNDIDYQNGIKRKSEEKGSKSARRSTAKSIGGDQNNNRDEFSSLKCVQNDRTVNTFRENIKDREGGGNNKNNKDNNDGILPYQKYQKLPRTSTHEQYNHKQNYDKNIRKMSKNKESNSAPPEESKFDKSTDQDYSSYLENEKLQDNSMQANLKGNKRLFSIDKLSFIKRKDSRNAKALKI